MQIHELMFLDNGVSEGIKPYSYAGNCSFKALISGVFYEQPPTTYAKWFLILIFNFEIV